MAQYERIFFLTGLSSLFLLGCAVSPPGATSGLGNYRGLHVTSEGLAETETGNIPLGSAHPYRREIDIGSKQKETAMTELSLGLLPHSSAFPLSRDFLGARLSPSLSHIGAAEPFSLSEASDWGSSLSLGNSVQSSLKPEKNHASSSFEWKRLNNPHVAEPSSPPRNKKWHIPNASQMKTYSLHQPVTSLEIQDHFTNIKTPLIYSKQDSPTIFRIIHEVPDLDAALGIAMRWDSVSKELISTHISQFAQKIYDILFPIPPDLFKTTPVEIHHSIKSIVAYDTSRITSGHLILPKDFRNSILNKPQRLLQAWVWLMYGTLFSQEALFDMLEIPNLARRRYRDSFFDWLWGQVFDPPDSLPVFGQTKRQVPNNDINIFGKIQDKLVNFMATKKRNRTTYLLAFYLIENWSKTEPVIWEHVVKDQSLWVKLAIKVCQYHKEEVRVGQDVTFFERFKSLGDFQVVIERQDANKDIYFGGETLQDHYQEKIMSPIQEYKEKYQSHVYKTSLFLKDASIVLEHKTLGYSSKIQVFPRIVDFATDMVPMVKILSRTENFLKRLQEFHDLLLDRQNNEVSEFIKVQFSSWFSELLFGNKDVIPIMGIIDSAKAKQLTESPFSPPQLILINILAEEFNPVSYCQAALTVLGYWFKNFYPEFWREHFLKDDDYWRFMYEAKKKRKFESV
ncbi:hypothetical protein O181_000011 [Austropuccinia psidii MF-1]|uniref:Uncharacterized protein n=1 Tax=Austropuccinia psidii MF-1 TaxID=1389203 RepID=A0A9Q3B838_9BASI|nr:hypothetical protein [Austropuccinia psidii MF-1]